MLIVHLQSNHTNLPSHHSAWEPLFFTLSPTLGLLGFWMGVYLTLTLCIISSIIIPFLHMIKLRLKNGMLR